MGPIFSSRELSVVDTARLWSRDLSRRPLKTFFTSHCRLCLRSTFETRLTRLCHVYNLFVSSAFCHRTSSEVRLHISHHLPAISHFYHIHILLPVVSNDHMSFTPFVWNILIALPRICFRALTAVQRSTSNYVTLIQFSTWQLIQPTRFIPSIQSPPYNPTTIDIALKISFPSRPLHQPVHIKPHILILDISLET